MPLIVFCRPPEFITFAHFISRSYINQSAEIKMNYLDKFLISFKGLKNGEHSFEYVVGHEFFEAFNQESEINGEFQIKLHLLKESRMMVLHFDINGYINSECHLCLEPFKFEMNEQKNLIVKYGQESSSENDEVMILAENTDELNIAQHIYDYVNLAIPLRIVHPEKENGETGCDIKALKKMEQYKHQKSESESDDSRWQALKKIKFD